MPNWCNNGITLRHADPAMIDRVVKGKEGLLSEFLPCPQELTDTMAGSFGDGAKQQALQLQEAANVKKYGYKNWYDWQVANWGTKWDVSLENLERVDANTVRAAFESAWSPPVDAYVKLLAMGFFIEALYYEPGMCFVGKFVGDEDDYADDYFEYGGETSATVREAIGEELDDYFGISEEMAQYEEENADE